MVFWSRDYVGADNPKAIARRRGADYIRAGLMGQAFGVLAIYTVRVPNISAFWLGWLIIALATPVLLTGCIRHATHKHYHWKIGVMLGLLNLPGVLVLYCLPDRHALLMRRRGFDVVMPRKVSSTWVVDPDDPDAPRFRRPNPIVRYEDPMHED